MVMILPGKAASEGVRSGAARVVRGPADLARVQAGDIAVSAGMSSLMPLLRRAAALVCEAGGPLCSLTTVVRECGTPMVVALPRAATVIEDGDLVTVDGTAGLVLVYGRRGDADARSLMGALIA